MMEVAEDCRIVKGVCCSVFGGIHPEDTASPLGSRVATWNARGPFASDLGERKQTLEFLAALAARLDVLMVQETHAQVRGDIWLDELLGGQFKMVWSIHTQGLAIGGCGHVAEGIIIAHKWAGHWYGPLGSFFSGKGAGSAAVWSNHSSDGECTCVPC